MTVRGKQRRVVAPVWTKRSHPAVNGWLRLASSGWYVKVVDAVAERDTMSLVAADAAWHFEVEDWVSRRPRRRRILKWRRWRIEEHRLAGEQARLVASAFAQRSRVR